MVQPDFSEISNNLLAESTEGESLVERLNRRCPKLVRNIEADSTRSRMLQLWGNSLNLDENSNEVIVPLPIIQTLGTLAGVIMQHPIVHAGATHTYGYLFSTIETPYGWKRDRWVKGKVATSLGMPARSLSPQPRYGTLLTNLSYVLGRIAFRGRPSEMRALRSFRSVVDPALEKFKYSSLRGHRIVETVIRKKQPIRIYTDIIEPPHSHSPMPLLVYWWSDNDLPGQLITAFPISPESVEELLTPNRFAANVEIAIRYNGYIEALNTPANRPLRGTRTLLARSARFRPLAW